MAVAVGASIAGQAGAAGQTISGRLLDLETDLPINLGLVMMFTESGDSVTSAISSQTGHFSLSAPGAGTYVLRAAALGYRETSAGVFELGADGALTVEYRLPPQPVVLDALIVSLDRPVLMHHLVRNGFIRRLQRGLGAFITPHDIEESSATSTEQLMEGVPGVRIGTVRSRVLPGVVLPRPDIGETIQIQGVAGWCVPTIYLDGMRFHYNADIGITLSSVADLETIEAIEIYRRPAEIPVEYTTGPFSNCGVIVVWTKLGLAPGQAPSRRADDLPDRLPMLDEQGSPPEPGERIRMQVDEDAETVLGLDTPWEGTFLTVQEDELVAQDPTLGRAIAVPLEDIDVLHVSRRRGTGHAILRGAIAGALMGAGTWVGLSFLCSWSDCDGTVENPWLPAGLTGLFVGVVVQTQGPGTRWVSAPLPRPVSRRAPAGVDVSVRVPIGGR